MRVTQFKKNSSVYSANAYLVRGDWNAIDDKNTLIDVGTDGFILEELSNISTGVGKSSVEQIIFTHEHFDHAAGVHEVLKHFEPKIYAYATNSYVTDYVQDGMKVKIGDREAEILYTPGHSNDSICVYCKEEKCLFSGDTAINIKSTGGSYTRSYVKIIEHLLDLDIQTIYSGHDKPLYENVEKILHITLKNILSSKIVD